MDETWAHSRKRSNIPALVDSSDSEPEEILDPNDLSKKMRVGTASVHDEYDETRGENGKYKCVCKHCPTIYNHRNCTGLMLHLKSKHPLVHKNCEEKDEKIREELTKQKKAKIQIERERPAKDTLNRLV